MMPFAIGNFINSFSIGFGSMMPYILVSEITTITARAPTAVINTLAFAFGGFTWLLGLLGVIPVFTGITGRCPGYLHFGITTCN